LRKSQDTLRTLADETGGFAVINQNDFVKAVKRLDAETSDYYVLGLLLEDADPATSARRISVLVKRADIDVHRGRNPDQGADVLAPEKAGAAGRKPRRPFRAPSDFCASEPRGARERHPLWPTWRLPGSTAVSATGLRFLLARRRFAIALVDFGADEIHAETPGHATAVLPSPVNGPLPISMRSTPCRRRHCSGNREERSPGCGRSRSRRWMVSVRVKPGIAAQRYPPRPDATARCSIVLIGHARASPIERVSPGGEMKDELVAIVEEARAVDRLVVPDGEIACHPSGLAAAARSIAMDLIQ